MSAASIDDLRDWVCTILGRAPQTLDLIPGGGSRTSYVVRMNNGQTYLLRADNGKGVLSGTTFTIEREHRVISALHKAGFPVPAIFGYDRTANAMLMEFVSGKTSYQVSVSPGMQSVIQRNLMEQVVALHRLDMAALGLSDFARLDTVAAALESDLATLRTMYERADVPKEPEIDFALRWLSRNIPDGHLPSCLVHGDVGPGNFLFKEKDGALSAIIDWEVTHMGHPLEDLAAVLCRALGVPFGENAEHIANYERFAGETVDRATLDYLIILVLTRWYVGLNNGLSHLSTTQNIPVILTYRQSVAYTLISLLAKRFGMTPPPFTHDSDTQHAFIHGYITHTLEDVITPALDNPFLSDRALGVSKLAKYLRDLLAFGPERLARMEQDEIEALTGETYPDLATARAAACTLARSISDENAPAFMEYLLASSSRKHRIWAAAMGDMAEREMTY